MSPHRIVGKWYYGLGNGQYIRYEFTIGGAYRYSNPARMITGTYVVQDDQLTMTPEGGAPRVTPSDSSASARAASPST